VNRLSVRARLTVVYAGLFLVTGAALLGLNYTFLDQFLPRTPSQVTTSTGGQVIVRRDAAGNTGFTMDGGTGPGSGPAGTSALEVFTLDFRNTALHQLLIQSTLALAVMGILAALMGWVIAGRIVRPVKAMTEQARRLSERNLHERIGLTGPQDEMKDLADTFDAMLARLDAAFDSQKTFVANASHELRTPLAITRAAVEVQLQRNRPSESQWRAMADQVLSATERSDRLIGSLLLLARVERGSLARERVELGELLDDVAAEIMPHLAAARLRLSVSTETVSVDGDVNLLRRLIGNMLENAVRYNVDGGWVTALVGRSGNKAVVTIANSGASISPEVATQLFEPFKRGAASRIKSADGSGLGLSIVATIAVAHGGTVQARPLPGGGLEVIVYLPARHSP
jgi:signal transduction histidine kinase